MKNLSRRELLAGVVAGGTVAGGAIAGSAVAVGAGASAADAPPGPAGVQAHREDAPKRPARLRQGDSVALVAPATVTYDRDDLLIAVESLEALGLKVRPGEHVLARYGYFAGTDEDRAADINAAFTADDVDGVIALRGGWGAARTHPHLDLDRIAANPKVFLGYSDITTLLNAFLARSSLVAFHGPNGSSPWTGFTTQGVRSIIFNGEAPLMRNPEVRDDSLAVRDYRISPIVPGRARGRLVGGNLTLFSGLVGTPWFPDVTGALVFLEEVGEYIYRCDRMLTQLALAGVFEKAAGVILGGFTGCGISPDRFGTFSLNDVFEQHLGGLGKPVFSGAMIGHVEWKRTVPIGVMTEMDARAGTIQMLEPAVL